MPERLDFERIHQDLSWMFAGGILGIGLWTIDVGLIIISLCITAVFTIYSLNPDMKVWTDKDQLTRKDLAYNLKLGILHLLPYITGMAAVYSLHTITSHKILSLIIALAAGFIVKHIVKKHT